MNRVAYVFLRSIVGVFFVVSGLAKLWDLSYFADIVSTYIPLPDDITLGAATVLCLCELVLGASLAIGYHDNRVGQFLLTGLVGLTLFSVWKQIHGDISDCGCFGKLLARKNDLALVVENTVISVLLIPITFRRWNAKTPNGSR